MMQFKSKNKYGIPYNMYRPADFNLNDEEQKNRSLGYLDDDHLDETEIKLNNLMPVDKE